MMATAFLVVGAVCLGLVAREAASHRTHLGCAVACLCTVVLAFAATGDLHWVLALLLGGAR